MLIYRQSVINKFQSKSQKEKGLGIQWLVKNLEPLAFHTWPDDHQFVQQNQLHFCPKIQNLIPSWRPKISRNIHRSPQFFFFFLWFFCDCFYFTIMETLASSATIVSSSPKSLKILSPRSKHPIGKRLFRLPISAKSKQFCNFIVFTTLLCLLVF